MLQWKCTITHCRMKSPEIKRTWCESEEDFWLKSEPDPDQIKTISNRQRHESCFLICPVSSVRKLLLLAFTFVFFLCCFVLWSGFLKESSSWRDSPHPSESSSACEHSCVVLKAEFEKTAVMMSPGLSQFVRPHCWSVLGKDRVRHWTPNSANQQNWGELWSVLHKV